MNYDVITFIRIIFILRRPGVTNFAGIIKIVKELEIMHQYANYICILWYSKTCWAVSNSPGSLLQVCHWENLWQWFPLEIKLSCLSSVKYSGKAIHYSKFLPPSNLKGINLKILQTYWKMLKLNWKTALKYIN